MRIVGDCSDPHEQVRERNRHDGDADGPLVVSFNDLSGPKGKPTADYDGPMPFPEPEPKPKTTAQVHRVRIPLLLCARERIIRGVRGRRHAALLLPILRLRGRRRPHRVVLGRGYRRRAMACRHQSSNDEPRSTQLQQDRMQLYGGMARRMEEGG